jgi:hypothetical protein
MHRLEWEQDLDGGLWALLEGSGLSFLIQYRHDASDWELETTKDPLGERPERTEQRYRYLQDAMAAAELQATVGR